MKKILAVMIVLVALAAVGQQSFQRGVVTTNANQEAAVINIVQTNKNAFTGSTNTFAGTIKQTGGGTGLLLSGALTFTSLGGNINDADGANRIGIQKATSGGIITIYDTNGTPAVTFGKDGNMTNTLKFETATERITAPGSAASVVNLALDANNNLVTNASPVGGSGSQTPWAGNIAGAGHSLSGVDTIGTTNLTAELVTFGRTAAGGGRFSGDMTLMATNGYYGEFGFNFDGHATGPNRPTQMGFSLFVTNSTSANNGVPVLSVGQRVFSEIPVVISNTAFANSGVSNLFMTLGTNGGSVVVGPGNGLTVTSSAGIQDNGPLNVTGATTLSGALTVNGAGPNMLYGDNHQTNALRVATDGVTISNAVGKVVVGSGTVVASATITATNGFSSDATHFFKAPTNSPTDGQVITATGTAGDTQFATPSVGGGSGWVRETISFHTFGATPNTSTKFLPLTGQGNTTMQALMDQVRLPSPSGGYLSNLWVYSPVAWPTTTNMVFTVQTNQGLTTPVDSLLTCTLNPVGGSSSTNSATASVSLPSQNTSQAAFVYVLKVVSTVPGGALASQGLSGTVEWWHQ